MAAMTSMTCRLAVPSSTLHPSCLSLFQFFHIPFSFLIAIVWLFGVKQFLFNSQTTFAFKFASCLLIPVEKGFLEIRG